MVLEEQGEQEDGAARLGVLVTFTISVQIMCGVSVYTQ